MFNIMAASPQFSVIFQNIFSTGRSLYLCGINGLQLSEICQKLSRNCRQLSRRCQKMTRDSLQLAIICPDHRICCLNFQNRHLNCTETMSKQHKQNNGKCGNLRSHLPRVTRFSGVTMEGVKDLTSFTPM